MTAEIEQPAWVDALDRKLIDVFPGRVVRKDLVQRLKIGFSIPVYVLEYLLGKYCSTTDENQIEVGVANVKEMIKERIVRSDQNELIKARLQRYRSMKLIDMVTVTFDEKDQGGKYWAKFATSGLVKVPRLWDLVGEAGKRSVVLGVPQTYPPKPFEGEMVTCFLTPNTDARYTHPASLKEEVERLREQVENVE